MENIIENKDLLMLEYQKCLDGYHHRDMLMQDEFFKLVQSFVAFLTLLLAFQIFGEINWILKIAIQTLLFFAGFLALVSLLLEIQANTSCKEVLRTRCIEIEDILQGLRYWAMIQHRRKFFLERRFKGKIGEKEEKTIGHIFVFSSKCFIILWFLMSVIMVGYTIKSH